MVTLYHPASYSISTKKEVVLVAFRPRPEEATNDMDMQPLNQYNLVNARQQTRLQASQQRQLVKQARADQPGWISSFIKGLGGLGASLLGRLGGFLIETSGKLEKQAAPPAIEKLEWAEK